jgi:acyl-CoA thioesterase FadM
MGIINFEVYLGFFENAARKFARASFGFAST